LLQTGVSASPPSFGYVQKDGTFAVGNNWYVVGVNSTHTNVRCSIGGNGFRPGGSFVTRTLNLGANGDTSAEYGSYYNGTHLIVISGDEDEPNPKRFYAITLGSNCAMTASVNQTMISTGQKQNPVAVTQNGTHTFAIINGNAGTDLWRSDLSGTTWTNVTRFATTTACCAVSAFAINWTNNRIIIIIDEGVTIKSRIYYTLNQTFGTMTTIETSVSDVMNYDCVAGTYIFCTYLVSFGDVQGFRYFDGSSWSANTTVSYPGSALPKNTVALAKNNGDDTIIVFTAPVSPIVANQMFGMIKYNKTSTNGTIFISSGDFHWHTLFYAAHNLVDDNLGYLSVSHRPNGSGWIGVGMSNLTLFSGSVNQQAFGVFGAFVIPPTPSTNSPGGPNTPAVPPFFPPIEQVLTPTVPQNQNLLPPELLGLLALITLIVSFILIYANRKSIGNAGKSFKVGGW